MIGFNFIMNYDILLQIADRLSSEGYLYLVILFVFFTVSIIIANVSATVLTLIFKFINWIRKDEI